jgi:cytoskeleton protein RodZ
MSDEDRGDGVSTIGERLRVAREEKGLSLDEVAAKTRIPIRHLKHIEVGEWDALPAPTYSVGFVRSYANAVGLNGNELGAELRQEIGHVRPTYETPQNLYEPADPARVPPRSLALVAAVIALLLVVGWAIWRSLSTGDAGLDPAAAPVAEAPVAAPAPAQPQASVPLPTGPVVITATDEVWLRIRDAGGGAPLFQGIMQAGNRFEVPATAQAPQLRTGRPQALRVTVGSVQIPPLGEPEQTIDNVSLRAADLAARVSAANSPGQPALPQPSQPVPGPAAPPQ